MQSLLDTHQHLLYTKKATYNWTKDIPALAENDFTVDDYNSLTKEHGVAGSLFMEVDASDYKEETRFIKNISAESASLLGDHLLGESVLRLWREALSWEF